MHITRCPKCDYQRQAIDGSVNNAVCPACGIAYHKWLARQQSKDQQLQAQPSKSQLSIDPQQNESATRNTLTHDQALTIKPQTTFKQKLLAHFFYVPDSVDAGVFWTRAVTLFLFALWGGYFIVGGVDWERLGGSFMHNVNLPFHEFGHVLFSFFGRFMMILGGSLFQVIMPLGLMVAFSWQQRDNFAAAIMLWWSGQSFIDVSPYIEDAPYRSLPLIGGMGGESHDWGNLLTMMDMLGAAKAIANISFGIGTLLIITAIAWGGFILRLQKKKLLVQ